jgi:hypothetical protein
MVITRQEMAAWKESAKDVSMVEFVNRFRKKQEMVKNNKDNGSIEIEVKPKSERETIIAELDSLNVDFKKNASTDNLKKLLEESK